jgi:preprotein translocase subunit SecA
VEYQREGFDMFAAMKEGIREETVGFLFNLEVQVEEETEQAEEVEGAELAAVGADGSHPAAPQIVAKGLHVPATPQHLTYSAPSEAGDAEVKGTPVTNAGDPFAGVSRNAECPCGSGKKYKKCHGAPGGPTGLTARANG